MNEIPDLSGSNGGCLGCNSVVGSCLGVVFGLFLIPIAVFLLYWNEGRAVKVETGLNEGSASVTTIDARQPSPVSNGKLVYVTGLATADHSVSDPIFHIQVRGLALKRTVSMYQWVEHEQSQDHNGQTVSTYTYSQEWSPSEVHNSHGHNNTPMPIKTKQFISAAHCGKLIMQQGLIAKLGDGAKFPAPNGKALRSGWHRTKDGLYRGSDPAHPAIGDMKVSFSLVPNENVSVVAANHGGTLSSFATSNGTPIELIAAGTQPSSGLFKTAEVENQVLLWVLRLVGFIIMLVGFLLLTSPISQIAGLIPFVGFVLGDIDFLVSLGLAVITSLVTIAVGWATARPGLATMLLIIVAGVVALLLRRRAIRARIAP